MKKVGRIKLLANSDSHSIQQTQGYDFIGDVHGCGLALAALLEKMDYRKRSGVYYHPDRQAIFVGDIIDRGPHIRQALNIVYDMVDHGYAQMIMGNHEYNLFCYATPDPSLDANSRPPEKRYLREHTPDNYRLVAETLEQFANYPSDFADYLTWFSQLPLFLNEQSFGVVHACWDDVYVKEYETYYQSNRANLEIILKSTSCDCFEGRVLDRLLRGTSLTLPDQQSIVGCDGYKRRIFRTKFWAKNPQFYSDVVFQPDPLPQRFVQWPLSDTEKKQLIYYPETAKPIFFGHYWLNGSPRPVRSNLCCLDYSAVKYGRLVAYRYNGESVLDKNRYTWIHVDSYRDTYAY